MATNEIPERISRLSELAANLWWSWHEDARQLFRALDYSAWGLSNHNPVKMLGNIKSNVLQAASTNPSFLALYDSVMSQLDTDLSTSDIWLATNYPQFLDGMIAYFSMEYAIHNSLPIYAGGLGILAGDICKEASDLSVPMVAIGFMYPYGYFHQRISVDGWQQEIYRQLNFDEAPIKRILTPSGEDVIAKVQLGDIDLSIGVWQVHVGRTVIYLLDTNLNENPTHYKDLSQRLYVADKELRLQQEIVLGIGGVKVLRALGIYPTIWHANEGHSSFMMLERIREYVSQGSSYTEAFNQVKSTTVFTTHTPVLAGHDIFSVRIMEKYFDGYWELLGIDRSTFLKLGEQDGLGEQNFNMTALALRAADHRNAVSRLHGQVSRNMWQSLWPDVPEESIPILSITNGIHVPSWIAPEMNNLLARYLGKDWLLRHDDRELWVNISNIPDEELWAIHQKLKRKLVGAVRERMRDRWLGGGLSLHQLVSMGALLDPEALTIVFTRRFVEYKRPTLIFHDMERLKRIVTDQWYPLQIIFAGKSHPADQASKKILQEVYKLAAEPTLQGRIVFVEDYDMHVARYLVHGADVWLNNPRLLNEACGTSGMKAVLNGALHLSVPDGWWPEAYDGSNGWVIGSEFVMNSSESEDRADAESIYDLLEEEIIPLYYRRDASGIPHNWIRRMKDSIGSIVPYFCARRMLKEYVAQLYT